MGACCTGCWDGTRCQGGEDEAACGRTGEACEACDSFSRCEDEGCVLPVDVGLMAGGDITCAIDATSTRCSGSNRLGQLGIGTTEPVPTPRPISIDYGSIVSADAGDGCTCFLASDGVLGCVGANNFGQLGAGDSSDRALTERVDGTARFARIAVGATHVCAISRSARLYCWGNNFYGQLGVGDTGPRRAPTLVGLDGTFHDVAVGGDHTCAIRDDGELLCFGNGNTGQLGDDGNAPRSIAVRVGDGYAQVSAAIGTTCAVRLDGGLDCWGGNLHGQLGLGDTTLRRVPTRVGEGYVHVAVGSGHTCAARVDGTVQCFGENDDGELGRDASPDVLTPIDVLGLGAAVRVETGSDHSCATRADGTGVCWGANRSGQLGTASPETRAMPSAFPP